MPFVNNCFELTIDLTFGTKTAAVIMSFVPRGKKIRSTALSEFCENKTVNSAMKLTIN